MVASSMALQKKKALLPSSRRMMKSPISSLRNSCGGESKQCRGDL
jgi:hypothetical protein